MLGPMSAYGGEQGFSTLSLLEIALAETKTQGFSALLENLFYEATVITAENFNQIHLLAPNFHVLFSFPEFFFHDIYQLKKTSTFLVVLSACEIVYLPCHQCPVTIGRFVSQAFHGSSHSDTRGSTGSSAPMDVDGVVLLVAGVKCTKIWCKAFSRFVMRSCRSCIPTVSIS